jgi:hypothetical protein
VNHLAPCLRLSAALMISALLPLLTSCIASRASTSGPATITSFTANTEVSVPGAPVVLSWQVAGAAKLTISDGTNPVTGAIAVSATSVQVSPAVTTTYTLTATGGDGSTVSAIVVNASTGATAPAAVTVTVVPPPVISSFIATPSTIANGQSSTLSWSVANAATLNLQQNDAATGMFQGSITVTGMSSYVVTPDASTLYTLVVNSPAPVAIAPPVQAQLQVTVEQIPKPVISSFAASSLNIVTGGSTTLTWSVANQTQLTLQAVDANHPAPGQQINVTGNSYTATLSLTTTFTLVAANIAGVTATSNPVTVKVSSCPPPEIYSFSADPVSLGPGNPVALTAVFNGGLTGDLGVATVDNGIGTLTTGNPVMTAALNASTTYHLTVTNGCGSTNTAAAQVPVGNVTIFAGGALAGNQDGLTTAATFSLPFGMAIDSSGNVYVADYGSDTVRMITPAGNVTTIAGVPFMSGLVDGPAGTGLLNEPQGLAVDTAGDVFVADTGNNAIREIAAGSGMMTTVAGSSTGLPGDQDGTGSGALFNAPSGIAVNAQGLLYVVDKVNNQIRAIAPGGVVTTLAGQGVTINNPSGSGYQDGPGSQALFDEPSAIVLNSDNNLYVTDSANYVVREVTPAGVVSTIAGIPVTEGSTDGAGNSASFGTLRAIVHDSSGTLYVADTAPNYTIRRLTFINNAYTVDTIAGTVQATTPNPSGPLPAILNNIYGMALNPGNGNLYFTINNDIYSAPY